MLEINKMIKSLLKLQFINKFNPKNYDSEKDCPLF